MVSRGGVKYKMGLKHTNFFFVCFIHLFIIIIIIIFTLQYCIGFAIQTFIQKISKS